MRPAVSSSWIASLSAATARRTADSEEQAQVAMQARGRGVERDGLAEEAAAAA